MRMRELLNALVSLPTYKPPHAAPRAVEDVAAESVRWYPSSQVLALFLLGNREHSIPGPLICKRPHAHASVPLRHVTHVILIFFLVWSMTSRSSLTEILSTRRIRISVLVYWYNLAMQGWLISQHSCQDTPDSEGAVPAVRLTQVLLCSTGSSLEYQRSSLGEARRICGSAPALDPSFPSRRLPQFSRPSVPVSLTRQSIPISTSTAYTAVVSVDI
jgi:hypothetical protein